MHTPRTPPRRIIIAYPLSLRDFLLYLYLVCLDLHFYPCFPLAIAALLLAADTGGHHPLCIFQPRCLRTFTLISFVCRSEVRLFFFFCAAIRARWAIPPHLPFVGCKAVQHPRPFLLLLLYFCLCLPPVAHCMPCLRCTFAPACRSA